MLSENCKAMLDRHVDSKGRSEVCRELGISPTTLSQVLSGKYGASTTGIEAKIFKIYGSDGKVNCPVLGEIEPSRCADNHEKALKIRSVVRVAPSGR